MNIKEFFKARDDSDRRSRFNPNRNLRLSYVRTEPKGWPLTRPATSIEWAHVLKVMIMRRVPKSGPIHQIKLIRYVSEDLLAASAAGKIYVDNDFVEMRRVMGVFENMCGRDRTLRTAPFMEDPDMAYEAPAVYRTDAADRWLERVPVVVMAVVNQLPTTSVLDMMVQALLDDE